MPETAFQSKLFNENKASLRDIAQFLGKVWHGVSAMCYLRRMSTSIPSDDLAAMAPQAAAVRYLVRHGYEQTTASALADAIGMSRSTFFRRFGSKEDVVFSDHDVALARLQQQLASSERSAYDTIAIGTLEVTHLLTRDPDAARLRSELLRSTPSLRERELVITHRYERVFADYLHRVAEPGTPEWGPTALAAGVVAVHNAALRRWLRGSDTRAFGALERELVELMKLFTPWFGGERTASRVLVATFDANASPDEVLRAISSQLS